MSKRNKIEPINKNKSLVKAKIKSMKKNGRKEITTTTQLKKFPVGSLISYMNKKGEFRSGGYLWKCEEDNFIYISVKTKQKIRVKVKNVEKIWVGIVYNVKNDIISITASTKEKTNKPVLIGNVPVYYAKDNYDYNRYICTDKYKIMKKWYKTFNNEHTP